MLHRRYNISLLPRCSHVFHMKKKYIYKEVQLYMYSVCNFIFFSKFSLAVFTSCSPPPPHTHTDNSNCWHCIEWSQCCWLCKVSTRRWSKAHSNGWTVHWQTDYERGIFIHTCMWCDYCVDLADLFQIINSDFHYSWPACSHMSDSNGHTCVGETE